MPFSFDVQLAKDIQPVFPSCCCSCLRPRPEDRFAVSGRYHGIAALLSPLFWMLTRSVGVAVPACGPCRLQMVRQRRWRRVVMWGAVLGVLWFVYPWAKGFGLHRRLTKWVAMGTCLVALGPLWIWLMMRPPAVDVTVGKQHVDYEFRSRVYALLFLAENPLATSQQVDRAELADPPRGE